MAVAFERGSLAAFMKACVEGVVQREQEEAIRTGNPVGAMAFAEPNIQAYFRKMTPAQRRAYLRPDEPLPKRLRQLLDEHREKTVDIMMGIQNKSG